MFWMDVQLDLKEGLISGSVFSCRSILLRFITRMYTDPYNGDLVFFDYNGTYYRYSADSICNMCTTVHFSTFSED